MNDEERSIKEFENMVEYEESIALARDKAKEYVMNAFLEIAEENAKSSAVPFEEVLDIAQHNLNFHDAIWFASTEILPQLEVQVVIDGKNNCFVTTGSAGYVGDEWEKGLDLPIGLTLPIRCWIHTHPFGVAYFSGVDIRTVSIFEPIMECAYVLGGSGHHGFWTNFDPNRLDIYENNTLVKQQIWGDEEE